MQHIAAVMLLSKEDGHKNTGGGEKKHSSTTRTSTTNIRRLRKDASSSGVPLTRSSSKSGRSSLKKEGKSHPFKSSNMSKTKRSKKTKAPSCDPEDVNLADYPQWRAEQGYWIGEYTFLQGNGSPFVSGSWNYPYGNYKGFITGNISG